MSEEDLTLPDYQAAWSLVAAEARDDPDTASLIREMFEAIPLAEGLALVAQILLSELRDHADGCGCGSGTATWLEAYVLALEEDLRD